VHGVYSVFYLTLFLMNGMSNSPQAAVFHREGGLRVMSHESRVTSQGPCDISDRLFTVSANAAWT